VPRNAHLRWIVWPRLADVNQHGVAFYATRSTVVVVVGKPAPIVLAPVGEVAVAVIETRLADNTTLGTIA